VAPPLCLGRARLGHQAAAPQVERLELGLRRVDADAQVLDQLALLDQRLVGRGHLVRDLDLAQQRRAGQRLVAEVHRLLGARLPRALVLAQLLELALHHLLVDDPCFRSSSDFLMLSARSSSISAIS
jgi:hypothetical protein